MNNIYMSLRYAFKLLIFINDFKEWKPCLVSPVKPIVSRVNLKEFNSSWCLLIISFRGVYKALKMWSRIWERGKQTLFVQRETGEV